MEMKVRWRWTRVRDQVRVVFGVDSNSYVYLFPDEWRMLAKRLGFEQWDADDGVHVWRE